MPQYRYKARSHDGVAVAGTMDAASEAECVGKLASRGLFATVVRTKECGQAAPKGRARRAGSPGAVRTTDLIVFTRQLGAVYKAGIPLVEGLRLVEQNLQNAELRRATGLIRHDVQEGESLGDAFARHSKIFENLYVTAICAGQASGNLQRVFEDLESFLTERQALRKELVKSVRYPLTVLATMVLGLGVIFGFVVPRLMPLLRKFDEGLPVPTRILLVLHDTTRDHGAWILSLLAVAVVGSTLFFRSPAGRRAWERVRLRLPGVGPLIRFHLLSRFCATLAMLNAGGGTLVRNLEATARSLNSRRFASDVLSVRDEVIEGTSLSDALGARPMFPDMLIHLVRIGETSGRLDDFLEFLGEHYEEECRHQSRALIHWVEPTLTAVLGGAILFLALAIFLPYWNMLDAFRGSSG